jgi:hypothetical protein
MDDKELKRISKEVVEAQSRFHPDLSEGSEENHKKNLKRIASVQRFQLSTS